MDRVDSAFRQAPREAFLLEGERDFAHEDRPLPIGYGQTNSQPSTVRQMLEWLDVQPGDHVLDVGSGSGWTSALLSRLVGPTGSVDAVEKVPELVAFGRENCRQLGLENITFHQAGAAFGLAENAPYDAILVSAGAQELPSELVEQLAAAGTMVIPVRGDILVMRKELDGEVAIVTHPGYLFVPLV